MHFLAFCMHFLYIFYTISVTVLFYSILYYNLLTISVFISFTSQVSFSISEEKGNKKLGNFP